MALEVALEERASKGLAHARAVGPPGLSTLDPSIDVLGHLGIVSPGKDGALPEGSRANLLAPLRPGHHLASGDELRDPARKVRGLGVTQATVFQGGEGLVRCDVGTERCGTERAAGVVS